MIFLFRSFDYAKTESSGEAFLKHKPLEGLLKHLWLGPSFSLNDQKYRKTRVHPLFCCTLGSKKFLGAHPPGLRQVLLSTIAKLQTRQYVTVIAAGCDQLSIDTFPQEKQLSARSGCSLLTTFTATAQTRLACDTALGWQLIHTYAVSRSLWDEATEAWLR